MYSNHVYSNLNECWLTKAYFQSAFRCFDDSGSSLSSRSHSSQVLLYERYHMFMYCIGDMMVVWKGARVTWWRIQMTLRKKISWSQLPPVLGRPKEQPPDNNLAISSLKDKLQLCAQGFSRTSQNQKFLDFVCLVFVICYQCHFGKMQSGCQCCVQMILKGFWSPLTCEAMRRFARKVKSVVQGT